MNKNTFIKILGIAQDAGIPQCGCMKDCCKLKWKSFKNRRMVASIGIVDRQAGKSWMIDATPDFKDQWQTLSGCHKNNQIDGIFLTHGHIGHFTGLINLEKAVMNNNLFKVWAMPKLGNLIKNNLPWKSLVDMENIDLKKIGDRKTIVLSKSVSITPVLVPHRDEFSETVGFVICGLNKKILFLPDIDSWDQFPEIDEILSGVDHAFIDGTFFSGDELHSRDMTKVSHPTILTSLNRLLQHAKKINFIHFNHTNPVLEENSIEFKTIIKSGFNIANEGDEISI